IPQKTAKPSLLFPDIFPEIMSLLLRGVDVPHRVCGRNFRLARWFLLRSKMRNESRDYAIVSAADPNARRDAGVMFRVGVSIGYVYVVLRIDIHAAWLAKLLPLFQEFSIPSENLDAIVPFVADKQPSLGIHGDGMDTLELAGTRSFFPPRFDKLSILRKL